MRQQVSDTTNDSKDDTQNVMNQNVNKMCIRDRIGGRSGAGGGAGLFALASGSGVGYSYADVGSRLTYLPWAE